MILAVGLNLAGGAPRDVLGPGLRGVSGKGGGGGAAWAGLLRGFVPDSEGS